MMFTTGSYFDGYRVEKYIDVICEEVIFKKTGVDACIVSSDGWVYYAVNDDGETIEDYEFSVYRKKIDSADEIKIINKAYSRLQYMDVAHDKVYFYYNDFNTCDESNRDGAQIGCVNIDGSNEKVINKSEYPGSID